MEGGLPLGRGPSPWSWPPHWCNEEPDAWWYGIAIERIEQDPDSY